MGFALAEECASRGAEVSLISGPVTIQAHHPNIRRIDVESAGEMYEAAIREFHQLGWHPGAAVVNLTRKLYPVIKSKERKII